MERDSEPAFCKIMLGDFSKDLRIPPGFIKHMKEKSSENTILRSSVGRYWCVEVKKVEAELFFGNGWPDFVKDLKLEFGDFLVFIYHGNFDFDVEIFDKSGCEKKGNASVDKNNDKHDACKEKVEAQKAGKCFIKSKPSLGIKTSNSSKTNGGAIRSGSEPFVINEGERICDTTISRKRYHALQPSEAWNANEEDEKAGVSPLHGTQYTSVKYVEGIRPWPMRRSHRQKRKAQLESLSFDPGRFLESKRLQLPMPDNDADEEISSSRMDRTLLQGKGVITSEQVSSAESEESPEPDGAKFPDNQEGEDTDEQIPSAEPDYSPEQKGINSPAEVRGYRYSFVSKRRSVTSEEKDRASQEARAFQPSNPFFTVVMRPTHVYKGFFMTLPARFVKLFLSREAPDIILEVSNQLKWPVKCLFRKDLAGLSKGWAAFVWDNNLEEGDVCRFELVRSHGFTFKVSIFRVVEEVVPLCRAVKQGGERAR